jgi:hypothetical protein
MVGQVVGVFEYTNSTRLSLSKGLLIAMHVEIPSILTQSIRKRLDGTYITPKTRS